MFEDVGGADLSCWVGWIGAHAEAHVEVAVTVDDVVGATALNQVAASAAEQDVALAPHVAHEWAVERCSRRNDWARGSCERWHDLGESADAVDAGLVQGVAADEAASKRADAADLLWNDVVATENVVERPA